MDGALKGCFAGRARRQLHEYWARWLASGTPFGKNSCHESRSDRSLGHPQNVLHAKAESLAPRVSFNRLVVFAAGGCGCLCLWGACLLAISPAGLLLLYTVGAFARVDDASKMHCRFLHAQRPLFSRLDGVPLYGV